MVTRLLPGNGWLNALSTLLYARPCATAVQVQTAATKRVSCNHPKMVNPNAIFCQDRGPLHDCREEVEYVRLCAAWPLKTHPHT
jgi:hypothetical protein